MRAEERLKAEGRLVDGEGAPGDILAQVCMCVFVFILIRVYRCVNLSFSLLFCHKTD